MAMQQSPISGPQRPAIIPARRDAELREAAVKLEASFLSEMLKAAGLGEASQSFGGGIGEDQFASFLREAQAGAMAEAGGVGLADAIFQSLKERAE
jgi:flagellar protein FlgJ